MVECGCRGPTASPTPPKDRRPGAGAGGPGPGASRPHGSPELRGFTRGEITNRCGRRGEGHAHPRGRWDTASALGGASGGHRGSLEGAWGPLERRGVPGGAWGGLRGFQGIPGGQAGDSGVLGGPWSVGGGGGQGRSGDSRGRRGALGKSLEGV